MIDHASTDDVEPKDRLDYWQFVVSELVGGLELSDCDAQHFSARFDCSSVGDLRFCTFDGVSQTLHRKKSLVKSSDTDDYIVVLESDNTLILDHCGRQRSASGGVVLIDNTRPFFARHPQRLDVISVFLPRQALERVLGPARHAAGLSLDASQPSFPMISNFLRSLNEQGAVLDAASASRLSKVAIDLIAAAFAEKIEHTAPHTMSGAALLCRAQAYIADRLGVAGLSMQEVAKALHVSVRRLHQVSADEGMSLSDWMWELRLSQASSMLSDRAHQAKSVGGIAYQCGFVDQAHFSRRFKDRFGQSPSEFRASKGSAATEEN